MCGAKKVKYFGGSSGTRRERERESTVHGQRLVLVAYSCHTSSDEGVGLWLWYL